jgi:hypothetical protein
MRALTVNGQTFSVSESTIAADIHKPLDVAGNFTTEVAFNFVVLFKFLTDLIDFVDGKIINAASPINTGHIKDFQRGSTTYAIDVRKSDVRAFASRQVNSSDSGHV